MLVAATQTADVLDALIAALAAVPGVAVIDGQPKNLPADVLVVGFSVTRPAVEVTQADADLGGGRSEQLSIACLASSLRGETTKATTKVVRDRAVAIVNDAELALREDPGLAGLVERAELGYEMALDQARTAKGISATVEFTIKVTTL